MDDPTEPWPEPTLPEGASLERLVATLLADQRGRWRAGERVPAEDYLRDWPALRGRDEYVLELVYGEFLMRADLGDGATLDEYRRRFPAYAERLALLLALDGGAGPAAPDAPGLAQVPGYDVIGEVGRGGMGVVYRARQQCVNRVVALKMLRAGAADPEAHRRFHAEAAAAARLQHPNIVALYEVGEWQGRPYFTMEFVDGVSLKRRLADAPLPHADAAALLEVIARAAHAAHERGVVHRDLKPANILLSFSRERSASAVPALAERSRLNDAIPKIADFGLAKRLDDDGGTHTGTIVGTPAYMAPEQAEGKKDVGPPCDVYALGAILYECLTGRPPFRAATPLETLAQVKGREAVPPSRLDPAVPRDLETICLKCLAKDAARRYATARDLADDLGRFRRGEPIRARPVGPLGRARRWACRNPALAALLLALAAVVAGSGAGLALLWRQAEQSAAHADEDRAKAERSEEEAGVLLAEFIRAGQGPAPDGFAAHLDRQLDLLRRAEAHCRGRLGKRPDDELARAALADVYAGMARLHAQRERSSEADACLRQAEEALAALPPGAASAELLGRLAEGYDHLSGLCFHQGRTAAGLEARRRAALLAERLAREQPGPTARLALAESHLKLAGLMASSHVSADELARYAHAVRDWRELVGGEATPATRRRLAEVHLCLGDLYAGARQLPEAIRCWQTAADEAARLLDDDGPRPSAKKLRAAACARLVEHTGAQPYYSEAVRLLEEVCEELRARVALDPTNIVLLHDLTDALQSLGLCHRQAGATTRAAEVFALSARQRDRMVDLLAGPGHEADLIDELCQAAAAYVDAGDAAAALDRARRAATVLDRLTDPPGDDPARRELRAGRSHRLAHALRRAGAPPAEALARADESRRLFEELLGASPDRPDLAYGLYLAWDETAKAHAAADREEEAARAWAAGMAVLRDLVRQAPDAGLYRHEMAQRCMRLGRYARGQGRLAEAEAWFLEVEGLWPQDEMVLRDVAQELAGLASAAGDEAQRRHYRDGSERVARAAEAARRRAE